MLGLGISGRAVAHLLVRQGASVVVLDESSPISRGDVAGPVELAATLNDALRGGVDRAVVSPGVAFGHPWLARLQEEGIPVVPEFEYGLAALPGAQVVAVTGSNGKSSVVKWIADTLEANGIRAVPAGNYGTPPSALALAAEAPEVVVLELSSFQLEQAVAFHAPISVLLNFAPNHLDRHPDLPAYARAKAHLFDRTGAGDLALVHAAALPAMRPHLVPGFVPQLFGAGEALAYAGRDGWLWRDGERAVDLTGTWWGRTPLLENAAAALAVFDAFGITAELIRASAEAFAPLPHRMELVAEYRGVQYVNDSKSSTLTALAAAVASGSRKKHLIAGGILKESDLTFVKETLVNNAIFVYCIGKAAGKMVAAWCDAVPCEDFGHLELALASAAGRAVEGEMILLSPGCSSFDQFSGYGQRGDEFKRLVRQGAPAEYVQEKL